MASIRKTKKQGKKFLSSRPEPITPLTNGFRIEPWGLKRFCVVYTEKALLYALRQMRLSMNNIKKIRMEERNLKRKKQ